MLQLKYRPVNVRSEDGEVEARAIWQMECSFCGACGPTESEPGKAIASWNMDQKGSADAQEYFEFDSYEIKRLTKAK